MNHDRFYKSLINNLDARLTANHDIRELLDEIDVVDPSETWPSSVESPWLEGEAKVNQLCECFGLEGPAINRAFGDYVDEPSSCPHEINQLKSIIHTLPVSTADCERGFSTMNVIATKTRNRLLVKTINNLLFLSLVGPPQAKLEPAK